MLKSKLWPNRCVLRLVDTCRCRQGVDSLHLIKEVHTKTPGETTNFGKITYDWNQLALDPWASTPHVHHDCFLTELQCQVLRSHFITDTWFVKALSLWKGVLMYRRAARMVSKMKHCSTYNIGSHSGTTEWLVTSAWCSRKSSEWQCQHVLAFAAFFLSILNVLHFVLLPCVLVCTNSCTQVREDTKTGNPLVDSVAEHQPVLTLPLWICHRCRHLSSQCKISDSKGQSFHVRKLLELAPGLCPSGWPCQCSSSAFADFKRWQMTCLCLSTMWKKRWKKDEKRHVLYRSVQRIVVSYGIIKYYHCIMYVNSIFVYSLGYRLVSQLFRGLWHRNNGFLLLCLYGFVAQHFSGKMSRECLSHVKICAQAINSRVRVLTTVTVNFLEFFYLISQLLQFS